MSSGLVSEEHAGINSARQNAKNHHAPVKVTRMEIGGSFDIFARCDVQVPDGFRMHQKPGDVECLLYRILRTIPYKAGRISSSVYSMLFDAI